MGEDDGFTLRAIVSLIVIASAALVFEAYRREGRAAHRIDLEQEFAYRDVHI